MFRFKQFAVEHSRSSMKVGTDAVLLGAWCNVDGVRHALDVGTGCGVIALMLAQRCREAEICGIDIDTDSVAEASANFRRSPWCERLSAACVDFNRFETVCQYDLIISNPPFFAEKTLPPGAARSAARHTTCLTFSQLAEGARRLLAPDGTLAIIAPFSARDAVTEAATFAGLHLWRLATVRTVEDGPPKRLLWQWTIKRRVPERQDFAIGDARGSRTAFHNALCQDFYH